MSKLRNRLAELGKSFVQSLRRYPVEALLCLVNFAIVVYNIEACKTSTWWLGDTMTLLLPLYCAAFISNRLRIRHAWAKYPYYAAALLWIPIVAIPNSGLSATLIAGLWGASLLLLFTGVRPMLDEAFSRHLKHWAVSILVACVFCGLWIGFLWILYGSVWFLFGLGLNPRWAGYPSLFIALTLAPLMLGFLVDRTDEGVEAKGLWTVVINFIFTPALLIYTLILYLYLLKIIVSWQLPDGGLVWWVMPYIALGLSCVLLRHLSEKRIFEWYYRHFTAFSTVPLALLWIGIARRIGDYGLTEWRFYMLLSAVSLTTFSLMLLLERTRRFQWMVLALSVMTLVFTCIPGIRATDFSIRNQQARLNERMSEILIDGKFPEAFDYSALAQDSIRHSRCKQAYESWKYLKKKMPAEQWNKTYGAYGSFDFEPWRTGEEVIAEVEEQTWKIRSGIDLDGYNHMVLDDSYHYSEDSIAAVFYRDFSKKDTLLYCPVKQRLLEGGSDTLRLLRYENGHYMAVFEEITLWDDKHFKTYGRHLFEKKQSDTTKPIRQ